MAASRWGGETPGPDNPTPGFSPLLAPIFKQLGLPIPNPANGGGQVGAVLPDRRYIEPGSGTDGLGHLGFAAAPGLAPFGPDVFNVRRLRGWGY